MNPSPEPQTYVQVHALQAGRLTLPERFFVHPASDSAKRTVPSLSFLIQHMALQSDQVTRMIFDLGLRNPPTNYPVPIQHHIRTRQPLTTEPDVVQSLTAGGLSPEDVDYVVYSHIHWDHIGDPNAFPQSLFIVGPGTSSLLDGRNLALRGSHSFFEDDLLPEPRTIELPHASVDDGTNDFKRSTSSHETIPNFNQPWSPHGYLPRTIDIFQDGSILLVDAPGHLPGHINLLARTAPDKYVYLAGDACHDRRIMTREKTIGEWLDEEGHTCCIHANKKQAQETIERIQRLESDGVEIIFAHDVEWEGDPGNRTRFFGACLEEKGSDVDTADT